MPQVRETLSPASGGVVACTLTHQMQTVALVADPGEGPLHDMWQ